MTESILSSPAFFQDKIKRFICHWLNDNKTEFNRSEKERQLIEELQENFEIDFATAYLFAAEAIDLTQEQIDNFLATHDKKTHDKIDLVTEENDITHDKKYILTLNFKHPYYKLKNDTFTTTRGKNLYYKYFKIAAVKRRLCEGDIIRITFQKEFLCLCKIKDIKARAINDNSLDLLKHDGEYPGFTINSQEDFVSLINSFYPAHYTKATIESEKTLVDLERLAETTAIDVQNRILSIHENHLVMDQKDITIHDKINQSDIIHHDKNHDKIPHVDPTHDKMDLVTEKSDIIIHDKTQTQKNLVTPGIDVDDDHLVMNEFETWFNHLDKTPLDKKQLQAKIRSKFKELAETTSNKIKVKAKREGEFFIPAIQGLIKRYQKCYKKNCRCMKGHPHGPYYYIRIYIDGKEKQIYLGRAAE